MGTKASLSIKKGFSTMGTFWYRIGIRIRLSLITPAVNRREKKENEERKARNGDEENNAKYRENH